MYNVLLLCLPALCVEATSEALSKLISKCEASRVADNDIRHVSRLLSVIFLADALHGFLEIIILLPLIIFFNKMIHYLFL